ncbi:MAG TPA: hypothetical protein VK889_03910 [Solirubrobacterales bacterium]|nr:hypothetical protein [Solirubrobacterales bacterium]
MFVTASIATAFSTLMGTLAASIAVGGFLGHARPALTGGSEQKVRAATVIGGMGGCAVGLLVVFLSAIVGKVIA